MALFFISPAIAMEVRRTFPIFHTFSWAKMSNRDRLCALKWDRTNVNVTVAVTDTYTLIVVVRNFPILFMGYWVDLRDSKRSTAEKKRVKRYNARILLRCVASYRFASPCAFSKNWLFMSIGRLKMYGKCMFRQNSTSTPICFPMIQCYKY